MRSSSLWLLLTALTMTACAQTYAPALPGYRYEFPRDDFNHPKYQTEWWYYTGNLRAKNGHRFGFELTFFRQGVSREPSSSPWFVHDLYMAHLALSDLSGSRYYAAERLNRAGPGIAGADAASGTIWNGDWQANIRGDLHVLHAFGPNFSLQLNLASLKPPVIEGENGVSQKSAGVGHASHYISRTHMSTTGTIELNGKSFQVGGNTWMDHEFFSDSMGDDEAGWDWVSVQLDDNCELMLYRLRHRDGSVDSFSAGTYVDSQGRPLHLSVRDFSMVEASETWKSARTGATYPVAWSVAVPELKLRLGLSTPLGSQEFVSRFGPSYWEGAIDATGSDHGISVRGEGYLEMTGYSAHTGSLLPTSPQ